jgi:hypothetical protein
VLWLDTIADLPPYYTYNFEDGFDLFRKDFVNVRVIFLKTPGSIARHRLSICTLDDKPLVTSINKQTAAKATEGTANKTHDSAR